MRPEDSVTVLPGIGPATAAHLSEAGIETVQDLLDMFPVSYKDYTETRPLTQADEEQHLYCAKLCGKPRGSWVRGRHILTLRVCDEAGEIYALVRLFNQPYLEKKIAGEGSIYIDGVARQVRGRLEFVAPRVMTELPAAGIVPVYRPIPGIGEARLRHAAQAALGAVPAGDPLSSAFCERFDLPSRQEAYRAVHEPASMAQQERGRRRFDFERSLVTARAIDLLSLDRTGENDKPIEARSLLDNFARRLPYALTGAQNKTMLEIAGDLEGPALMNRLVEGDVGSGKTAVAFFAMYAARQSGYQSFLLAPTEVLAAQHAAAAREILGDETVLLTGSMRASARREAAARIASGSAFYIVGTQALLYGGLEAARPGLIVTDEQHRFGVRQRRTLLSDHGEMHSLIMSATPIPRSLALALSGMTSVSVLDERPAGRVPVETRYVAQNRIPDMYAFVADRAGRGEQAYIVCPFVEADPETGLHSAAGEYAAFRDRFPDVTAGLLHGRMLPAEKQQVMEEFRSGRIQVLIATTVVEVGLDVPGATAMIIHDADRFGLAQLHQLRGRVGRGTMPSWCFLTSRAAGAKTRLGILCGTQDGFEVAEADLRERGVGEVLGLRQHGRGPGLVDIRETWMIDRLRETLEEMARDPRLRADYRYVAQQAQELVGNQMHDVVLN